MKKIFVFLFIGLGAATGCVDNDLDKAPNDDPYPFRLIVDETEGGDLPGAEDYALEITFADYIETLPSETLTVDYTIYDAEDDMKGAVSVDKIIYEVEIDGCTYEREIEFISSQDNLSGTITLSPDADLGTIPETFEVIFVLPGEDSKGKFTFALQNLRASNRIILGTPAAFEYETLDNDVAGEWELELEDEEDFERFKAVFAPLNNDVRDLQFADITGKVKAEFEFGEMKLVIELAEEEEITSCEDGETETEIENKEIEVEADYEAEDGELLLEGSHFIVGEDGETEDELDFIVESEYHVDEINGALVITFLKVIDEDHFDEGDELFRGDNTATFTFKKD